jgi:hypothetical protein
MEPLARWQGYTWEGKEMVICDVCGKPIRGTVFRVGKLVFHLNCRRAFIEAMAQLRAIFRITVEIPLP